MINFGFVVNFALIIIILQICAKAANRPLIPWVKDIVNHWWFCSERCQGNSDVFKVITLKPTYQLYFRPTSHPPLSTERRKVKIKGNTFKYHRYLIDTWKPYFSATDMYFGHGLCVMCKYHLFSWI